MSLQQAEKRVENDTAGSESDVELDASEVEALTDVIVEQFEGDATMRDLLDVDDETIAAVEQQAYTFYAHDRFEKAEPLARGLVALDESRFYPNLLLGDILLRQGPGVSEQAELEVLDAERRETRPKPRLRESLEAFERAHEEEPDDEFVRLRLAELYLKADRVEEGVELLRELAEEGTDETTRRWAEALLEIGVERTA